MPTNLLYVLLLSTSLATAHAEEARGGMPSRWSELMKLVKAEVEMLENARKKGDEVHYRLLELYSERMKLTLEKENQDFLNAKGADKHGKKDKFFGDSLRQYAEVRSFGEKLLRDYPESVRRGAAYYTLALNSRDFGRDNRTEDYLLKALALIRPGTPLRHHAESSLADFYYNEKRFPESITYYERVVKNDGDEWLPKHLLNLGWCYLKTNRGNEAISTLQRAYANSKDKRYVDIREQVLQHLAPFFVFGGRVADGMEYYVKSEPDPMPYLLSLAKRAADKGHGKETGDILAKMQELITARGLDKHQEDLVMYELDFYRSYKRWDEHLAASHKLLALHRRDAREPEKKLVDEAADGVEKVRAVAGYLQLQAAKDSKKGEISEFSARDLIRSVAYFNLLRELDAPRKDEYAYFIGETYYALGKPQEAAKAYRLALEDSKANPVPERQRKTLNSLLALTGEEELPRAQNRELMAYTYENHVEIFPKDDMSLQIYPKLVQLHREEKRDAGAVAALERYHKNYPGELKAQQDMMKGLMDDFIKAKDVIKITHWIGEFKRGFLKFDGKTIEQTEIILGQILFVTAQEHLKKGERAQARRIFEDVFRTTLYPAKVRALAGVQAAEVELDMARPTEAIAWIEKSLELFSERELQEKAAELTAMLERMAYMREFRGAVRLTDTLLKKTCSARSAVQDRLWEMSVGFHLVLADDRTAQQSWADSRGCASRPEVARARAAQVMWFYQDMNDHAALMTFWSSNRKDLSRDDYVAALLDLYWDRPGDGQRELRLELTKLKDHPKVGALMADFKRQEEFQRRRDLLLKTALVEEGKEFDPEAFNPRLEGFLLDLKKIGEEVKPLLESEHAKVREQTHQQLYGFYNQVSDLLVGLSPKHSDADFLASFQSEMRKMAVVFQGKAVDFKKTARSPAGSTTFLSPIMAPHSSVMIDGVAGGAK
jgi:tetratricopeptide (TPR) repeat protein